MKKILFLLSFVFISALAFAQSDSLTLTFTYNQHRHVIAFLQDRGDWDVMNYIKQVAVQKHTPMDTAQQITIKAKPELLYKIYRTLSSQQEGLTNPWNDDLKATLMPQVTSEKVLLAIKAIADDLKARHQQLMDYVDKELDKLK